MQYAGWESVGINMSYSAIAPGMALPSTSTSMDGGNSNELPGTILAMRSCGIAV